MKMGSVELKTKEGMMLNQRPPEERYFLLPVTGFLAPFPRQTLAFPSDPFHVVD